MKLMKFLAPALLVALSLSSAALAGYTATGALFIEPAGWNVGDAGSTSQTWDTLSASTNNAPDAGFYSTNPAIATLPLLSVSSPGFHVSSGNFYSFSGNYPVSANIYNHGSGAGTHVIVQTAATLGSTGQTVLPGTLQIVDLGGSPITGGVNSAALVNGDEMFNGTVSSSMGEVTLAVQIWEFFLPGYTGDFRVQFTEEIHSSFDQLRVDSMITGTAFAPSFVPEPTSLALAGLCAFGLALSRKRR